MIIKEITMTCGACPSQWDAITDEGDYIYIRYRYGQLTAENVTMKEHIYGKQIGDGMDGVMSTDIMLRHLQKARIIEETP